MLLLKTSYWKLLLCVQIILFVLCAHALAGSWSSLGEGLGGTVGSLTVYGDSLIAGGFGLSPQKIAAWNGSSWNSLGPGAYDGPVNCLALYESTLVIGGTFDTAGGVAADNITSWNRTSFSPLGSGTDNTVEALAVFKGRLFAAGRFNQAGGVEVGFIAAWNGNSWSAIPGTNSYIFDLTVYNDTLHDDTLLVAGGWFTEAGGVPANHVAAWDGNSWRALGSGMNDGIYALTTYEDKLIAGGGFTIAGGLPAIHIAAWNGSEWDTLDHGLNGPGVDTWVYGLGVYKDLLIAGGGGFTVAGSNCIGAWNGSSWLPLGSGMNGPMPYVFALTVYKGRLVASGSFSTAGGVVSPSIAVWTECGDANGDGTVNISDAVSLIAYIFSGGPAPSPLLAGDANCDSAVNISDAVYLIAYIFVGGAAPCAGCK